MKPFAGFTQSNTHPISIPAQFFTELLTGFDHVAEIKLVLYAFWFIGRQEQKIPFVTFKDFAGDSILVNSLGSEVKGGITSLREALDRVVEKGIFLKSQSDDDANKIIYFLNSPQGKAAFKAFQQGKWAPGENDRSIISLDMERPNIFRLYEENIGPLTPLIADTLSDAENNYPPGWIQDAIDIAVKNNVRRWKYIEAILQSWLEKGRNGTNQSNTQKDYRRYIEGEHGEVGEY